MLIYLNSNFAATKVGIFFEIRKGKEKYCQIETKNLKKVYFCSVKNLKKVYFDDLKNLKKAQIIVK